MATEIPALRRDHRGSWRVRWTDAFGRRHSRSFGRDERAAMIEFRSWLDRWRSDPAARNPERGSRLLTVAEAWARYEAFAARYYRRADGSPTKEPGIVALAMRAVLELCGHLPAESLTPALLRAVQQRWISDGLASSTISGWTHKVRRVWRWMVAEGIVRAEIAEALRSLPPVRAGRFGARPPKAVRPVTIEAMERTAKELPSSLAAMVRLQALTGMRPGEVCSLRPCDVDTRGAIWSYRPPQHKTAHVGQPREILFGPQAQAILTPYLTRELAAPCFRPIDALRERAAARVDAYEPPEGVPDYRLWQSYRSRAAARAERAAAERASAPGWTTAAYGKAIAAAARRAGVEHWSPNQIRHAVATRIREQFGLEAAQIVLGHSRADVTQIYAERNRRLAEDLAKLG